MPREASLYLNSDMQQSTSIIASYRQAILADVSRSEASRDIFSPN
jgi:hypothetical protein